MIYRSIILFVLLIMFTGAAGFTEEQSAPGIESHTGTVIEAQKAGHYIYLLLDVEGKELWISAFAKSLPKDIGAGDKVEYAGGLLIQGFRSSSMKKSFDSMLLISKIRALRKESASDEEKAVTDDEYHENRSKNKQTVSVPVSGEIDKAKDGNTIEEIFTSIELLKDKEVTVRARVMKVNKNILNKNWITLSDGTGHAPDDILTAVTSENVTAGDILTVKGTLKINVSLGSGYKYKVLLEDAKFTK